jgi:hypothetical protein
MYDVFFKKHFFVEEFIAFYEYYVLNYYKYFYFDGAKNLFLYENAKKIIFERLSDQLDNLVSPTTLISDFVQTAAAFPKFTNDFKSFLNEYEMEQTELINYVLHLLTDLYFISNDSIFINFDFSREIYNSSYIGKILSETELISNEIRKNYSDKMYYIILPLNVYSYIRSNNFDKIFYEDYFYISDIFLGGFYKTLNINISADYLSRDKLLNMVSSLIYHQTVSMLIEFFTISPDFDAFYTNLSRAASEEYARYVTNSVCDIVDKIIDDYRTVFGGGNNPAPLELSHIPVFSINEITAALLLWIVYKNINN